MDESENAGRLTVETNARGNVLYATLSGEFDLAEAQSTFLQIVGAIRANNSEKGLVDGRSVTGEPMTIERFFYGDFVAREAKKLGPGDGPMLAYVLHEPVRDPMRLGETVALNRGMNLKVFDDYDIAIAWLSSVPPPPVSQPLLVPSLLLSHR